MKRPLSRGGVKGGLGGPRIVRPVPTSPKERRAARKSSSGEARRGVTVNAVRDRGVRGSIARVSWEENAHALEARP